MLNPRAKVGAASLATLVILMLPGCIIMQNPLSDPILAEADATLCGVWERTDDTSQTEFVFVGLVKGEEGTPSGLMRVVQATYSNKTKIAYTPSWFFTITEINGNRYANLFGNHDLSTKAGYKAWKETSDPKCGIAKYQLKGDQVTVWHGDSKAVQAASKDIDLQADSVAFIGYIKANGDAAFFPDAKKGVYKRIR